MGAHKLALTKRQLLPVPQVGMAGQSAGDRARAQSRKVVVVVLLATPNGSCYCLLLSQGTDLPLGAGGGGGFFWSVCGPTIRGKGAGSEGYGLA